MYFVIFVQRLQSLGRTLVVGRRTNVLLGNDSSLSNGPSLGNDSLLYVPDAVARTGRRRGRLFAADAEDFFFIAAGEFPWLGVRDVVVGRPGYDNYLVAQAIQHNVSVVDATGTLLAVHQTDADGNYAGRTNRDVGVNVRHIGAFNYADGLTTAAQYVTRYAADQLCNATRVSVERRRSPGTSTNAMTRVSVMERRRSPGASTNAMTRVSVMERRRSPGTSTGRLRQAARQAAAASSRVSGHHSSVSLLRRPAHLTAVSRHAGLRRNRTGRVERVKLARTRLPSV